MEHLGCRLGEAIAAMASHALLRVTVHIIIMRHALHVQRLHTTTARGAVVLWRLSRYWLAGPDEFLLHQPLASFEVLFLLNLLLLDYLVRSLLDHLLHCEFACFLRSLALIATRLLVS